MARRWCGCQNSRTKAFDIINRLYNHDKRQFGLGIVEEAICTWSLVPNMTVGYRQYTSKKFETVVTKRDILLYTYKGRKNFSTMI